MRNISRIIFVIGLALLLYGYLSRQFALYFFWDSKAFGWIVLFIALFFYFIHLNRIRRNQRKKTIWVKIGIGAIILWLGLLVFIVFDVHESEPYRAAIGYLKTNSQIREEVGDIKGFGLIPTGSMETTSINGVESGKAVFSLTVFGDKKYKDLDVSLRKTPETDWTVVGVY